MRCLLFQLASFRYQQRCTACFTEKQGDLSILMPLSQSVCRPYLPKAARQNLTTRFQSIRPCFSSQKRTLPARRCKSSVQTNIQFLAFDSAIGLHVLQNSPCAQHYDDSRFSILTQGRSPFHLCAMFFVYIKQYTLHNYTTRKKITNVKQTNNIQ